MGGKGVRSAPELSKRTGVRVTEDRIHSDKGPAQTLWTKTESLDGI